MTFRFDDAVRAAVLHHMNDDHTDDNLLIVRAFGPSGSGVVSATMTDFDGAGGVWHVGHEDGTEDDVRVDWPGGAIEERAAVRREIVALYDAACERLGVPPRPHA